MKLDENSFLLYAAKCYDITSAASTEEFYNDLKRFQYIKRLFRRYENSGDLQERLILNHIIVIYNCFGPMSTDMLFLKLKDYHPYLKPFILFLGRLPETITYGDIFINTNEVGMDEHIINQLRKI